jgi:hypothetical protein
LEQHMRIAVASGIYCALADLLLATAQSASAAVSFTGGTYAQDFATLPTSGATVAWSNDSTLAGWSLFKQPEPGSPIPSIAAGTGSSNTGAIYSFGASGSDERAFGGVGSGNATYYNGASTGSVAAWLALALSNDTNATIDEATVAFDGEQWRNGGNASSQTMVFEYGLGSSFETVATWNAPGAAFDFTSPNTGTSQAALDGNDPINRVADLGGTLSGLAWAAGETLWMRWVERNDAGNDHGLAVDDFAFTTETVDPPASNSDFDNDLDVDGEDFLIWQRGLGLEGELDKTNGDADGDGFVNGTDLGVWGAHFGGTPAAPAIGAVPEPASLALAAFAAVASLSTSRRR